MSPSAPKDPFQYTKTEATAQQEETRRLVRAMMTLTGQSASGLAKTAGLTPSTLNRFMHRPVRHNLSQSTLVGLLTTTAQSLAQQDWTAFDGLDAQALKSLTPALSHFRKGIVDHDSDLDALINQVTSSAALTQTVSPTDSPDVAVVKVTSQEINILAKAVSSAPFKTSRPPFLADDEFGFALVMPDQSMAPRYEPEDLLYVSPARTLDKTAQDVVIERAHGGFLVGFLAAVTSGHVALSLLQPKMTEFLPRDAVRGIYPVVGVRRA